MKFLENLGFNAEDINQVEISAPELLLKTLEESEELVTDNITFLKDLGVTNYKEVVKEYSDMFLMDPVNFQKKFLKYEKEDLIEKIAKNVSIVEHL